MASNMPSARDVAEFAERGAVCLRGVLDQEMLDLLQQGVDKDIAAPGPLHTRQQSEDDEGFFLTDFCLSQRLPELRSFVVDSPAAEIAARLMGSGKSNFFYDALWAKGRATPKRTRWHQDQPYYPIDGQQFSVVWFPLDPVTKDTCLELIAGSHRWGRWFDPELTRAGQTLYGDDSPFERLPDVEAERDTHEILSWDMEPGDCIAFHGLTVHGAPGNASSVHRRRAFSTFWMGDDAVFAARPGTVRPLFEGHGLEIGDPMDCDYFPRMWPAPGDAAAARRFTDPEFRVSI
jgi:ectoine hydroxylase-related dioxygenase (phytanoyl-CoA dioxygenase family)